MTHETVSLPHASLLLEALNRGELGAEELRMRAGDCAVLRVTGDEGPLILKVWARSGWTARTRQLTRTAPLQRELHALEQLTLAGVRVPKVWSYHLDERGALWTQALAMEDFGPCAQALDHVKLLLTQGASDRLDALLDGIVEMTRRMVAARVLDVDHGFVNILIREDYDSTIIDDALRAGAEGPAGAVDHSNGAPQDPGRAAERLAVDPQNRVTAAPYAEAVRVDLELARSVSSVSLHPLLYGRMLARLIGSFVFAVQPATERAENFAARVLGVLRPPRLVRQYATRKIAGMLRKQQLTVGIDTRVRLP